MKKMFNQNTTYNPYQSVVPEFTSSYKQTFIFSDDGICNMKDKVSEELVSPNISIGDNLNYSIHYEYDENYSHRLIQAGSRYYKYDENGNIICEQEGPFGVEDPSPYRKIKKEAENVYSTDYAWGYHDAAKDSRRNPQNSRIYTWDERNRLISAVDSSCSVAFVYGQDGQRTNKYTTSSETLYFNKMWTLHTDSGNRSSGGQFAKNIYLGETRIVTKLAGYQEHTVHEETYKQYYYHSDHLGSASLISDYKGDEYQRIEYTPYGETWVEKTQNIGSEFLPYKFTAKELDEETGLYYYGARYLDPKYSRWISTDPALGEYIPQAPINDEARKNNQNLPGMGGIFNHINCNLYAYGANNPVKYTDPDGRIQYPIMSLYQMQDLGDKATLNGTSLLMKEAGCAVAVISNMLSLDLNVVNNTYVNNGSMNWQKVADDYGWNLQVVDKQKFTKTIYENQENNKKGDFYTILNVNYTPNGKTGDHWVGLQKIVTLDGADYAMIAASSANDYSISTGKFADRLGRGWKVDEHGNILVPLDQTKGYITYWKGEPNEEN